MKAMEIRKNSNASFYSAKKKYLRYSGIKDMKLAANLPQVEFALADPMKCQLY